MSAKCSVCGMESDRADWVGKTNVKCDSHTPEQLKAAKAATHQAQEPPHPSTPPTPKEPPPPKDPSKEPHKDPSKEPQPKKATASLY